MDVILELDENERCSEIEKIMFSKSDNVIHVYYKDVVAKYRLTETFGTFIKKDETTEYINKLGKKI